MDPNEIILRVGLNEDQAFSEAVRDSCERVFSKAQIRVERKSVTERDQSGRVLCAFDDFVGEQSNRPASSARRRGAVAATLVLLASVSWFGYLQLRDLENQAARAEHSASLLKMRRVLPDRNAWAPRSATRQLQTLDDNSVVALMDDLTS